MLAGGQQNDFVMDNDPLRGEGPAGADTTVFNDVNSAAGAIASDIQQAYKNIQGHGSSSVQAPMSAAPSGPNYRSLLILGVVAFVVMKLL